MAKIKMDGYRCEACGHEWVPRSTERPALCPKCKSLRWDKAREVAAR